MVISDKKKIIFEEEAKEHLAKGALIISKAVGTTLGPWGKNVGLGRVFNPPRVTKDGVSVAHEIILENPVTNISRIRSLLFCI